MPQQESPQKTTRINLVENLTQRFKEIVALGPNSGIVGIGVVGVMIVGGLSIGTKDVRIINCVPTKVENPFSSGEVKVSLNKRPGFVHLNTPGTGAGNAIRVWLGSGLGTSVITAFGNTNSTIYSGLVSLGSITGLARDITETFISAVPNLVIPSSNNSAWYYPEGGVLTQVMDSDYPGNAGFTTTGTFVHLDGYSFIMTTNGRIWNCDNSNIGSWGSQSFISTLLSPDTGVGLSTYKNKIVAFGKESIEFFENIGNPVGSPLQRIPELFIKLGSPKQDLISNMEDTIMFVSSSSTGSYGVYKLENYQPKKVSYPDLDSLLAQIGINNFTASTIRLWGKSLYILYSTYRTYIYSLDDDLWFEWQSTFPLWYKIAGDTTENIYSISSSLDSSVAGKVFRVNQSQPTYQDNGTSFLMTIQTSKIDFGNNKKKRLGRLHIIGAISASTQNLNVSYTDDDYLNYSTIRTIDLSKEHQFLNNLGTFRRRSFLLTNLSSEAVRLGALELDYTQGEH
jgi:hypothetical protein